MLGLYSQTHFDILVLFTSLDLDMVLLMITSFIRLGSVSYYDSSDLILFIVILAVLILAPCYSS